MINRFYMLQSSSKANIEMDPLDSPDRRESVISVSFTPGTIGSGKESNEDRVKSMGLECLPPILSPGA